jgi:hypothetical protein
MPLKYGDIVAILVRRKKGIAHLRYKRRRDGIDLSWSKKPRVEWQIRGGKPGDAVDISRPVSLFNTAKKAYLVYSEWPRSIGLKWRKTRSRVFAGTRKHL